MKTVEYSEIVTHELKQGAIINNEFHGFKEDYLVLHCLLKKHLEPLNALAYTVLEIGTNMGTGTNIICNAVPKKTEVFSLELVESKKVGSRCKFPYRQLFGDSMQFDFSKDPCDAYFIDGEHSKKHVTHETKQALKSKPLIIIFHDADIPEVMAGIHAGSKGIKAYDLYRVEGTRIAYLLKK